MDNDSGLKRKYEILPGVSVPDMKTLAEASHNYDEVGVEQFEVKAVPRYMADGTPDVATAAELEQLKALGVQVAEAEVRQSEESRKRMESIMSSAVQPPSTLNDLKKDAAKKISGEKKKQLEESMREQEEARAEEEAKQKAREDRRKLQHQMLEDAKKKAEAEKANAPVEDPAKAEEPSKSDEVIKAEEPAKSAEPVNPAPVKKPNIVTEAVDAELSADLADAEFGEFIDRKLLDEDEDTGLKADIPEENDPGSKDDNDDGFFFVDE